MSGPPIWSLRPGTADYPEWLEVLEDYPPGGVPVVHGIGVPEALTGLAHDAAVTIVGSRRASSYGLRVAESLARDLSFAGATVISGMALGIDAAAHRGALDAGGPTVAVLAGGPDVVYPAANTALYEQIVARGAAISEHPPGTQAQRHDFRVRNRIMAALAKVVVIVEAAKPSGSLVTAERARDFNRELGAVPGHVGVRVAEGTNGLLRQHAHPITCAQDVLDLLAGVGAAGVERTGPSIDRELADALEHVIDGATTLDRLASAGALSPQQAAVSLARLELLGYLTADATGAYCSTGLRPPE